MVFSSLTFLFAYLPLTLAVDDEKIRSILENDCASFNVDPVDATLSRENGAFVVTEGQTGVVIDVAGSEKAITELFPSNSLAIASIRF